MLPHDLHASGNQPVAIRPVIVVIAADFRVSLIRRPTLRDRRLGTIIGAAGAGIAAKSSIAGTAKAAAVSMGKVAHAVLPHSRTGREQCCEDDGGCGFHAGTSAVGSSMHMQPPTSERSVSIGWSW